VISAVATRRRDGGETLVEILITVVVLAITVTALIGGITLGIVGSDVHRRLSDVEVVARAYGEQVIDQATHGLPSTTLADDAPSGATSIHVKDSAGSAGFPTGTQFTIAVDGEVVGVKPVSAGSTSWSLISPLEDPHPSAGTVQEYLFYDATANKDQGGCPTTSTFALSSFSVPGITASVGAIQPPAITAIEYFDAQGTPVAGATCDNYWQTTGTPCNAFDPSSRPHETQCDIDLVRLTISATSVDAGTQRGATTTTRILIRRGNS
jgi:type II secretory pathway pseudopilin PulG